MWFGGFEANSEITELNTYLILLLSITLNVSIYSRKASANVHVQEFDLQQI